MNVIFISLLIISVLFEHTHGDRIREIKEFVNNQKLKAQDEMQTLARELNLKKVPSRIINPSVPFPSIVFDFNSGTTGQLIQVELDGRCLIVNGSTVYTSSSGKFMIVDSIVYDNKKPVYDLDTMRLLGN